MLNQAISDILLYIEPFINDVLVRLGVAGSLASDFSTLLCGLLAALLVLAVVIVPFVVLSFLLKLIWRFTNVDSYN